MSWLTNLLGGRTKERIKSAMYGPLLTAMEQANGAADDGIGMSAELALQIGERIHETVASFSHLKASRKVMIQVNKAEMHLDDALHFLMTHSRRGGWKSKSVSARSTTKVANSIGEAWSILYELI